MIEIAQIALLNLKQHKLRTFLSGISIMTASFLVCFTLVIGDAIKYSVKRGMDILGMTDIVIDKYNWEKEKMLKKTIIQKRKNIGIEEFIALKNTLKNVRISRVIKRTGTIQFKGKLLTDVDILGVDPSYISMRKYEIGRGRLFSFGDNITGNRVCVLGWKIANKLGVQNIPEYIQIDGKVFRVIGILKKKGEVLQNKPDEVVLIPFNLMNKNRSMALHINFPKNANRDSLKEVIHATLFSIRKKYGKYGKFGINDMEEVFKSFKGVSTNITYVLLAFSLVALFVGGIGITNVMLTSARERIKEVGILKSMGLTVEEIFLMFICESVAHSLVGSSIGIIGGYMLAYLLLLLGGKGIIVRLTLLPIVLAFFMSFITGILSGIYPGIEASRREVIEALRYL